MTSMLLPGEFSSLLRSALRVVPLALALALAAAPALAADPVMVGGAQVAVSSDVTAVAIQIVGEGSPTVSPFRQTNPERLVIDIAGAKLAEGPSIPRGGVVINGEFSTFNDGQDNVRLTLFLSRSATWTVSATSNTIVVALRPGEVEDPLGSALSAAPPSASSGTPTGLDLVGGVKLSGPDVPVEGATLTTLDFQQRDKVSRVLFATKDSEPAITQPERNLITVDLPGAFVPESLRREVDTRFFYSAVDSVRAYPTRAGGRIAIRLREGAEYSVKREDGLTVIEVTIPGAILAARDAALQRPSAAAPSTPETNGSGPSLSNSSGSEILISDTGKSMDPTATLGNGGGTNAPGRYGFASDVTNAHNAGVSYTGRRMSIDLQEADIHTVFRFIADFGEVNIVTSDDVKGNVTVRLKDVPWDEALASILQAKGLGAQQLGRVVRVAPLETIKAEQIAALEASKAEDQLEKLSLYVAPLNYAAADEVKDQVATVLSERGSIEVDSRSNQLIIQDAAEEIAQARELIRSLDRPTREVLIEARFVEANSTFTNSLGVQWGSELDASAATGFPTGGFFPSSVGAVGGLPLPASGGGGAARGPVFYTAGADSLLVDLGANAPTSAISFALGSISGLIDINARLSAAVAEGWGKIVSSPRVTAIDNTEAVVSQGARIPYQTTSQNGTQTQFVNAVLELRVTPHITTSGTVFLDLDIHNDRPDFSFQTSASLPPGISTKSVTTKILVPDGDTAVLGGVYSTSESFATSRVPGLGDIPVLGYLFKNSNRTRTQNEMLVFITPRIIPVGSSAGVATK